MVIKKAVNNYCIVELCPISNTSLVDDKTVQQWGVVRHVGPGTADPFGKVCKPPVEEGDLVYCMKHGMYEIHPYEERMGKEDTEILVVEYDIMGILKNNIFQPLFNSILVKPDPKEVKSKMGLQLTSQRSTHINTGTVIRLGTGWRNADGSTIPFHVEEGDRIVFDPTRTMRVSTSTIGGNEDYILIGHGDIMGVIENE